MTTGIRIRGSQGQVQIDDTMPNYVVLQQGTFSGSNYVQVTGGATATWAFFNRHVVNFPATITSDEAPLIFLQFDPTVTTYMGVCQVEGGPGAWTGFSMALGDLQGTETQRVAYRSGNWFAAGKVPNQGSGARVGVRIRNRVTNQIVYDSGYKLVKFLEQNADFKYEDRIAHPILKYSVGYPQQAQAYFLANAMTGLIGRVGTYSDPQGMSMGVTSLYPNKLLLTTFTDNDEIAYQSYQWTALFGIPGS